MEAIAALSLACNVIQLVETSLKVANTFRLAYKDDSTQERREATRLSSDFSSAVGELQTSMQRPLNKNDNELNDIAQQCLDKAIKLQKILSSMAPPSSRRRDKIKSGIIAKQLSLNGELKNMVAELQSLRKDFDTRVLVSLR